MSDLEKKIEDHFIKIVNKYSILSDKVEVEAVSYTSTISILIRERVPSFYESAYGCKLHYTKNSQDIELSFSGKIREAQHVQEYAEFMSLITELQMGLDDIKAFLLFCILQSQK
jgi:hypothetical protein